LTSSGRLFYKGHDDDDDDDETDSDNVIKLAGKSVRRLPDQFPIAGSNTPSPLLPPPPPPPPHMMLVGPGDCTLPRPGTLSGLRRKNFETPARSGWLNNVPNGRIKNEASREF
jgi:hypothetical protein